MSTLSSIAEFLKSLLDFFVSLRIWRKEKNDKIEAAKDDLKEITQSGNLTDLINATNKLGKAK